MTKFFKKMIWFVFLMTILFFAVRPFVKIGYVAQNQLGFKYNVSGGKPVNQDNNPLLPFGYGLAWGWNAKLFIINAEVNNYNFTTQRKPNSPYDESLTWDSQEGVTMSVNYTILGRVTDPWKFYNHFGRPQYSYRGISGVLDAKIYEAIRLAGQFVDVKMGELTQNTSADEIRKNPAKYTKLLTTSADEYANQFGFTVTDVLFPDRFVFPGGNTIQTARGMLQIANSDGEKLKNEKKTTQQERDEIIANARIEANRIISEGKRESNRLLSEADALAEQLQASIHDIGIKGTVQITMSRLHGKLMQKGVITEAILTRDSIFGKPFYTGTADSEK
ncbi:SPFH domain-containing protein [Desulfobacterales bacterium HSG16]|nr:SPFH domain-containing protein [Desulfobacterales bacterium HSG16]